MYLEGPGQRALKNQRPRRASMARLYRRSMKDSASYPERLEIHPHSGFRSIPSSLPFSVSLVCKCFLTLTRRQKLYIDGVGGVWVQLLGGQGTSARVILLYVNVSGMRPRSRLSSQPLTKPTLWAIPASGGLSPLVPPSVTASRFLAGNREAELKPTA